VPRSPVPSLVLAALIALVAAPRARAAASEPASWRGDVRFLVAAVDSIHPAPYRFFKRAAWDSATADLERRLPNLRPEQAIAALSQLLGMLRDGHTRLSQVQLPSHGRPVLTPLPWPGFDTAYPLEFEVFADGLWIVGATAAHAHLAGTRVLAIGGRPVAEAVAALTPFIPADNPMWTLRALPAYLRCPGYLAAAGLTAGPGAPLRLKVATGTGGRRDVKLAAEKPDSTTRWLAAERGVRAPLPLTRRLPYPFAFADLDDSTVFARIHAIVSEPGRESLSTFVARLFAHVDSMGSRRLVLDLRGERRRQQLPEPAARARDPAPARVRSPRETVRDRGPRHVLGRRLALDGPRTRDTSAVRGRADRGRARLPRRPGAHPPPRERPRRADLHRDVEWLGPARSTRVHRARSARHAHVRRLARASRPGARRDPLVSAPGGRARRSAEPALGHPRETQRRAAADRVVSLCWGAR
jgi:hypothetical protein